MTSDDLELLRSVRRAVHRWPELGHEEHRTSALIAEVLTESGLKVFRPAATSVAAVAGPEGRPAVALRADLDAIACTEETALEFTSQRPGVMHACGHDGHLAALVVVARRLARQPPESPVLLIFQQAEETHPSGARLVTEGLGTRLWPAGQVYAIHLWPELPEGTVGLRRGPLFPGITGVEFSLQAARGRAHGTRADDGSSDALSAMWRLCAALSDLPGGRHVTESRPAVLHVGQASAGEAPNRPAESGLVRATMRWIRHDEHDRLLTEAGKIADRVSGETDVRISVSAEKDIRPLVTNDSAAVERAARACHAAGLAVADYPEAPVGVSDDFGHYSAETPGALLLVGSGYGDGTIDLHSPSFNFREETLLPVVEMLEHLARPE